MSNLRLINQTTTTVAQAINVTDVFSADYDIYKIVISGLNQDTNVESETNGLRFINSSGSVITASDYDYGILEMLSGTTTAPETKSTTASAIYLGQYSDQVGEGNSNVVIYVFNPFNSSSYTFTISQNAGYISAYNLVAGKGMGVLHQTNSITGFQIYESDTSKPFESGSKIITYGLRVD